jgi:hypothetical protein
MRMEIAILISDTQAVDTLDTDEMEGPSPRTIGENLDFDLEEIHTAARCGFRIRR